MRATVRALLGGALVAAWAALGAPAVLGALKTARANLTTPPSVGLVEARLAMLPPSAADTPPVRALTAALVVEARLQREEATWNHVVGGLFDAEERARGLLLADLDAPSPPPPAAAPTADGEVVALLDALLDRWGYVPVDAPEVPIVDAWPGVDRRARLRALRALVAVDAVDEARARVLVRVTLDLLRDQVRRGANLQEITRLFPIAMGEAAGG